MDIRFGYLDHNFISMSIIRRSYPTSNDFWDGNWLDVVVSLSIGSFRGSINGQLRADEIMTFKDELDMMLKSLSGQATFATMEEWLTFQISGNKKGHLSVKGSVRDQPGYGNILQFTFDVDQAFLPDLLLALQKFEEAFPVRGNADHKNNLTF